MTAPTPLMPRTAVPKLAVALTDGTRFVLGQSPGKAFDMLVFYRGLHCPICTKYLLELERLEPDFRQRGVQVVAISSDDADRGKQMAEKVKAKGVKVGYGLALQEARTWGLYISSSRGKTSTGVDEPALFSEPGVFLIRPDGTLYYGSTQTMPFARPAFQDLLGAIDFAISSDYPARGEYSGEV
ncbi:MAG: peroxiredoxin-like family protein [Ramlibacter sp.]